MELTEGDVAAASAGAKGSGQRRPRADAQRNVEALLQAAKTVFASAGVDAPAKEITDLAGVGVGTLYRHFPRRSDLIVAVLEQQIDACASAAKQLSAEREPWDALTTWLELFTAFVATKRGLATALHSGDSAFDDLPRYFMEHLEPAVDELLAAARKSGDVRADIAAGDILLAIPLMCQPVPGQDLRFNERMIRIFVNGLRHP